MSFLSQVDVHALSQDPSPENRERTVVRVAEVFKSRALQGRAALLIDEVIRIFAHDAALRVRQAVSEQLQHDPDLPHDVALALANDVDAVAVPILRFSRALSDEDLADIVESQGLEKLCAIASRMELGEDLSDALINHGEADVVATLLANGGSAPSEAGLMRAIDRFPEVDRVQIPLARRPALPQAVMAKMVTIVSDHVLQELSARKDLPSDLAADIMQQAEERAFLQMSREQADPEALVRKLAELGRLTPNLAMRALLTGDVTFFEHTAMRLTGLPRSAVCTLAFDSGSLGMRELCRRMSAPEQIAAVIEIALKTYCSIQAEDGVVDCERFQARMIERILSQFDEIGDRIDDRNVDALIGRLRIAG